MLPHPLGVTAALIRILTVLLVKPNIDISTLINELLNSIWRSMFEEV